MADQFRLQAVFNESIVDPVAKFTFGKFGKCLEKVDSEGTSEHVQIRKSAAMSASSLELQSTTA